MRGSRHYAQLRMDGQGPVRRCSPRGAPARALRSHRHEPNPRHRLRTTLSRALRPSRIASAACLAAAGLTTLPAQAADRWWTYIGGCAAADWLGRVSGTNAQGQVTCWSSLPGGVSGQTPPTALDNAYFVNPGATATLLTTFADPSRAPFVARVDQLALYGSASFAVGLSVASQSLVAEQISLGIQDGDALGRIDQSGGSVSAQSIFLASGEYRLTGGTLSVGVLNAISQYAPSLVTMSGGTMAADVVRVSSRFGRASEVRVQAGTVNSRLVRLGTFFDSNTAGVLALSGAGTSWVNSEAIAVGVSGVGALTLAAGASLQTNSLLLAEEHTASGSVTATDAGTRVTVLGAVTVGSRNNGMVSVLAGASWAAGSMDIGSGAATGGHVSVAGTSSAGQTSRWTTDGAVVVGRLGRGSLQVGDGGQFAADTLVAGQAAGSDGQVSVAGTASGNIRSALSVTGQATIGNAGAGRVTVTGGAQFGAGSMVLGGSAGGSGQFTVVDPGSAAGVAQGLTVGAGGTGTLVVGNGALLRVIGGVEVGTVVGSSGTVTVETGATLRSFGSLAAGWAGDALLQLRSGGIVDAAQVTLGPRALLTLDGGTLRTAEFVPGDGRFDWRSGTLHLTANAALGGPLPAFTQLGAQQSLKVDGTLVLGPGTVLRVNGGSLAATTVSLAGGFVLPGSAPLDLSPVGTLAGSGVVGTALAGGGGNRIVATGGALTLGDLNRVDGYAYGGTLDAGANTVLLLDRDLAELGSATLLADGRLASVNGIRLGGGRSLTTTGAAVVQGLFANDGAVDAASGVLTFLNDVVGTGSFAGNIVFRAGFATGTALADVRFDGGDLSFGEQALLTIKLDATGADRLLDIGGLRFDGTLALQFGAGALPTDGTRWQLLDFDSFTGRLDASRIVVSGFDATRLDFSQLPVDGTLAVLAVPEPRTALLWLAGLAALGVARRGRRDAQAASRRPTQAMAEDVGRRPRSRD